MATAVQAEPGAPAPDRRVLQERAAERDTAFPGADRNRGRGLGHHDSLWNVGDRVIRKDVVVVLPAEHGAVVAQRAERPVAGGELDDRTVDSQHTIDSDDGIVGTNDDL